MRDALEQILEKFLLFFIRHKINAGFHFLGFDPVPHGMINFLVKFFFLIGGNASSA